ncbi:MAG: 30S ribosomal protein S8 [Candidatus Paceibacterota bacterium]
MDQIANMVNMIKNAGRAGHESVTVSFSKIKQAIAECLLKEGYISSLNKKMQKGFPVLEIGILYVDGAPKVGGVERISKSSCRVYKGVKDIRYAKGSSIITVFSTPKGVLTDKEARKQMVGGEVLFKIW